MEFDRFQIMMRQYVRSVWQVAQRDVHSLDEDEQKLAMIMRDHEEFADVWADIDGYIDQPFDPQTEVDPFLHVAMHHVVEKHIRNEDPLEAARVFEALKTRGLSREDAIHAMGAVFIEHATNESGFDHQAWLADLIRLPMTM